jgi:hypothetical protein
MYNYNLYRRWDKSLFSVLRRCYYYEKQGSI